MKVKLQYGRAGIDLDVPNESAVVIRPKFIKGIREEHECFLESVRNPLGSPPLDQLIEKTDRVAVVIPDITRPMPSRRLLKWLFGELAHVPPENFSIIIGTGSHRPDTPGEIVSMVGEEVARRYRVLNHDAYDPDAMELAGHSADGHPVFLNKEYVRADKRIVTGFIEPHFFAGFSGGYKGIFPGIADMDSIMHYHRASVIGDERSDWGILDGNPTQEQIRTCGALVPVDFCINVALNSKREITGFFCGDVMEAHLAGCSFVGEDSMAACSHPFRIVITTNGGYPLDQNLYQTVKGISAASKIVSDGGLIIACSECSDGFPEHGNFKKLLFEYSSASELLDAIQEPGFSVYDQWEAQKLALVLMRARVALFSSLSREDTEKAHLEYVEDLGAFLARELKKRGKAEPMAVLPEGPHTIPYVI